VRLACSATLVSDENVQKKQVTPKKKHFLDGAKLYIFVRFIDKIMSIISILIIARLLGPAEVGQAILALTIYASVNALTQNGLASYIIKVKVLRPWHFDLIWTYGWLLRFLFLFVLMNVFASLLIHYSILQEFPQLGLYLHILSLSLLLMAFFNVYFFKFIKQRNFALDVRSGIYARIFKLAAVLVSAVYFKTGMALIFGQIVYSFVVVFMSYHYCEEQPRIKFDFKKIKRISRYALSIGVAEIFISTRVLLDKLVISILFGPAVTGQFHAASRFTNEIVADLKMLVTKLIFPIYAPERNFHVIKKDNLEIMIFLIYLATPFYLFISFNAEVIVVTLLGKAWEEASIFLPLLSVLAIVKIPGMVLSQVIKTTPNTFILSQVSIVQLFVFLLVAGIFLSINGISIKYFLFLLIFLELLQLWYFKVVFTLHDIRNILNFLTKFSYILLYCVINLGFNIYAIAGQESVYFSLAYNALAVVIFYFLMLSLSLFSLVDNRPMAIAAQLIFSTPLAIIKRSHMKPK